MEEGGVPGRAEAQHPDDLAEIKGIGDAYSQRLYRAGIFTWHQLANTAPERLRTITRAPSSSDVHSWIAQARELAEKYSRVGATYSGPVPDDLSRIRGIGEAFRRQLYEAGIFTYAQLAASTPAELAHIISAPAVGEELRFDDWIAQAAQHREQPHVQDASE